METALPRDLKRFATKKEGQVKSLEWVRSVITRARVRHKTPGAQVALKDLESLIERTLVLETEELMRLRNQLNQNP